jgi:hypothetical protein
MATKGEIAFIQKVKDSDIDRWCKELYGRCVERDQKGSSTLPLRPKRGGCKNSPEYATYTARVKVVAEILNDGKRACVRFRSELTWAQKLADDPVWELDSINSNENGNADKAHRLQQQKDNGAIIVNEVQALKLALLADDDGLKIETSIAKLDQIESFATYIKDPPEAERIAAGKPGRGRGKGINNRSEESSENPLTTPGQEHDLSPYLAQPLPCFDGQPLRIGSLMDSGVQKRKLDSEQSVPGTQTPRRKTAPVGFHQPRHTGLSAALSRVRTDTLLIMEFVETGKASHNPDTQIQSQKSSLVLKPPTIEENQICSAEYLRKWHAWQQQYQIQQYNLGEKQKYDACMMQHSNALL